MENDEKMLTPEESLGMISNMILLAKKSILDKGFHYILWGWLICIASILDYILLKLGVAHHYYGWYVMPFIGIPVGVIYNFRNYSNSKSHLGTIISYLWIGFLITGILIFVMGVYTNPEYILQYFLLILGFALFVTGRIIQFRPVYLGGIVFWLAALACIFAVYPDKLLINAFAALLGSIIPGYLLKRKFADHV